MKKVLAILGLLVLTLLYFHDVLTGKVLLVERDLTTFFYPFRFAWVETVRQGHFPFWNPYIKCGVPLFATIQPGVLYPLSLLYFLLPLDLAFNWTIILHFFLAAAFTYALMHELGAGTQGALAAALAFLFSGYLISIHNVLNTLLSASWYPLVILCGCRMVQTGLLRWAVATSVSLCCMFLGGGMEIVLLTFASLLLLSLYPGVLPLKDEGNKPTLQRRLISLGLVLLIFLGLCLIQILPFLELYGRSQRHGGMELTQATLWSLAPKDMIYFLLPSLYEPRTTPDLYWKFQNYLKTIYVGPVVLCLAGFYFVRQGKRGFALLAAMVLSLVFAFGGHTPLYPFFHRYFPLFATMRYPVKFIVLFVFYLCLAAGLGLDFFCNRFSKNYRPPAWFQGLLVALIVALGALFWFARLNQGKMQSLVQQWGGTSLEPAQLSIVLHNYNRMLVVTVFALIVIFFGLRHRLPRLGGPFLIILLVLDLFLGNFGHALKLDAASFHGENDIIRTLRADPDLFRFHVMPQARELKVPGESYAEGHENRKKLLGIDLMMEHHLFDINGYNVPQQSRYEKLFGLILSKPLASILPLLDMLNVKYVITGKPVDLQGLSWVLDGPGTSKLYENHYMLPRAFLVKQFQVLSSEQEFAEAFHELTFDPQSTILLEKEPTSFIELKKKPSVPNLHSAVRVLSYENNRIILQVNTSEAALLFMSEAYYPGWQAYVDGQQSEVLRANYIFRAIPVGPGSHRVEVVCEPSCFKVGLMISLLTVLSLLAVGVISSLKSKKMRLR